ncbi:MAG: VOC family protein, partial [Blastocatellia bacterium]
ARYCTNHEVHKMLTRLKVAIICLFCLALWAATPARKRPRLLGVAHMALYVSDIEKSRGFYRDFLGYQEPFDLKNADGSLSLTFFKVNEDQYIELFPGLKPEQDRLNHISFQTDDAEAMRAYLASRGVKVPDRANKVRIGNTSFNVKDADGHTVEITQYEPTGWTRREKGKFLAGPRISTRILHAGIIVGDATAAMKFYADILGLREFWRGAARNSDTVSWINMRLPESEDYVEFMLYTDQPAPDKRGSQHHICLEVPDIEKALAQLEASPYRKQYTRPLEIRTGVNRRRQLNLFDPDGTRIELMEPRTVDGAPAPSSTAPLPRRRL